MNSRAAAIVATHHAVKVTSATHSCMLVPGEPMST